MPLTTTVRTTIPRRLALSAAALALTLTTGCAIGNSGKLVLARHVSVGQELLDLKAARDAGAITQEEYEEVKAKVLELVESIEVVDKMNDATPGGDDD